MSDSAGRTDRVDPAEEIQRVAALLDRIDVRNAVLVAANDPMALVRPGALPVPEGMTWEQAVDLVTAVIRTNAAYSPIPDRDGRVHWFVRTTRVQTALTEIDRHCTADSVLYQTTMSRSGARFLVQANVDEAVAAAQLDGMNVHPIAAKELLFLQRQPSSAEDRLVVNQFLLTERLPEMIDRPWTVELMLELYSEVARGVTAGSATDAQDDWPVREAILRELCSFANHPAGDRCQHPAIVASILRAVIIYLRTFPAWNGVMSRIVYRLYAIKQGYPVLGYLPISRSELELERFRGIPLIGDDAGTSRASGLLERYHEADATAWLDTELTLTAHALRQFLTGMRRAEVIDEAVRSELREDESLNHRQRSILGRALRIPDATFRIAYHRTTHGIGYATAHRDLVELVSWGYLVEELQGRMKVFRAGPRLEQRLGVLQDIGRPEDFKVALPPELLAALAT